MAVGKDRFKIGLGGIIDELHDWNTVKSKIQENPYPERSLRNLRAENFSEVSS